MMYDLKPIKITRMDSFQPMKIKHTGSFKPLFPMRPIAVPKPLMGPNGKSTKKTKNKKLDMSYIDNSYSTSWEKNLSTKIDNMSSNPFSKNSQFHNPFNTRITFNPTPMAHVSSFKPQAFSSSAFSRDKYPPDRRKMNYSDAYFFYKLKPFGDIDQDGVPNWRDCRPYDSTQDGKILDAVKEKVKTVFKKDRKTPMNDEVENWGDSTPSHSETPKSSVWEETKPDTPNPNNAYKTAFPEVWKEPPDDWDETEPQQSTALVPYVDQPGVEYGGAVVPVGETSPTRTGEIVEVPPGELGGSRIYVEQVENDDSVYQEPMKQVGYYRSADQPSTEPIVKDAEFVDNDESEEEKTDEEKESIFSKMKTAGGKIKEKLTPEEVEWDGIWRLYFRQKKGKWQLYGETKSQAEIFNTASQLESQQYIAEVFVDKRPADVMLRRLNMRLNKERFVGEVTDITERTKKGVEKIDKEEAKEIRRAMKQYGSKGATLPPGAEAFLRGMNINMKRGNYRRSMTDDWGKVQGYDLGLSGVKTGFPKAPRADIPKPKRPQRGWSDMSRGTTFATRQQYNMYDAPNYSDRKVPPNMMGNGRVQRYNPVTARESFFDPKRRNSQQYREQEFQQQPYQDEQQYYAEQPQPEYRQTQQGFGFPEGDRARGLGLTGGQRPLHMRRR